VKFNDTIHTLARVTGKRATKRPDRGIIKIGARAFNQDDELVLEAEWAVMTKRIGKAEESAGAERGPVAIYRWNSGSFRS
jgi:hypothetical protein